MKTYYMNKTDHTIYKLTDKKGDVTSMFFFFESVHNDGVPVKNLVTNGLANMVKIDHVIDFRKLFSA